MLLQLLFVLVAIIVGACPGGIGLGSDGRCRPCHIDLCFRTSTYRSPIDVMLMIVAVISAASCMQAAGGGLYGEISRTVVAS